MKKFFEKHSKDIVFVVVMILCVVLLTSAITLLNGYSDILDEQARNKVQLYAADTEAMLSETLNRYAALSENVMRHLARGQSQLDFSTLSDAFYEPSEIPAFGSLSTVRYFRNNEEYDLETGLLVENEKSAVVQIHNSKPTGVRCIGAYHDYDEQCYLIGFYVPIDKTLYPNSYADAIVTLYSLEQIRDSAFVNADQELLDFSDFVAFCTLQQETEPKGIILKVLYPAENDLSDSQKGAHGGDEDIILNDKDMRRYGVITEFLKRKANKGISDEVAKIIKSGSSGLLSTKINGDDYIVSVNAAGNIGGELFLIGLYRSAGAYNSGYEFANSILSTLVVCFIILIATMLYFIISSRSINRKIFDIGTVDPILDCPTMLKFDRETTEILARNRVTKFAVILAEVRFFNYITENFGEEASMNVLKYMKTIYYKSLQTDEAYAYLADGQFVLLFHYKEKEDLLNRLKGIYSIGYRYPGLRSQKYSIKLQFGIYEIDRSLQQPTQNMVDKAITAKNSAAQFGTATQFKFYTEELRKEYVQSADIEVRMEQALKNDEFKVFFQPKYNVAQSRQDGCEALVRWYDPDNNYYRPPDTFLPLFEANGFIAEVDRYVYLKVCEYIREAIERGQSVYPVSVNVSRITAIQPDFISYYSKIKRQYRIVDNFLTLEFTESFAYENYDALKEIIDQLHKNGFQCSIDDFGSGYSSYNILKELPMDEIKLDRFFISRGLSEERDNCIIESVIQVAKTLKMKITQEGVETQEDMERMRKLGCDVIQGYYYSKPLPMVDYIAFTNDKNPKKSLGI